MSNDFLLFLKSYEVCCRNLKKENIDKANSHHKNDSVATVHANVSL